MNENNTSHWLFSSAITYSDFIRDFAGRTTMWKHTWRHDARPLKFNSTLLALTNSFSTHIARKTLSNRCQRYRDTLRSNGRDENVYNPVCHDLIRSIQILSNAIAITHRRRTIYFAVKFSTYRFHLGLISLTSRLFWSKKKQETKIYAIFMPSDCCYSSSFSFCRWLCVRLTLTGCWRLAVSGYETENEVLARFSFARFVYCANVSSDFAFGAAKRMEMKRRECENRFVFLFRTNDSHHSEPIRITT